MVIPNKATPSNYDLDPNGLSPHSPGAKLDSGKLRIGLMVEGFALALKAVSEVTTYGANKYTPNGWLSVHNADTRYTDALYRHLLEHATGVNSDEESDLKHLAHAAWNVLALLELELRKDIQKRAAL